MIEICTVGGYGLVGRNCTAINVDGDVVLLDLGLHLDNYISYTEDEDIKMMSIAQLTKVGAVPNISHIADWRKNVKAIIPSHAHLDHIGAIPFISNKFYADILCSPYTGAVINSILKDERISLRNEIKTLNINSRYKISDKITVEFINATHSTPQSVIIALHTKYGTIVYANDYKFDNHPVIGKRPNFERLKQIGKKNVTALISDCLYSAWRRKTPSELVAKDMLKDVLLGTNNKGKAVIVTTFSSHLARLKSIIECGKQMRRKVVFVGRSLAKYVKAGEDIGLVNFSKDVQVLRFGGQVRKELNKIIKNKGKYLIACTGHQGERKAVLSRLANQDLPFDFKNGDFVVFSSSIIPNKMNRDNREVLEKRLKDHGVRIFRDIHVSGHASREDHRDMINMLKPKHIIPAHGEPQMEDAMASLAKEEGYKDNQIHIMKEGERLEIK